MKRRRPQPKAVRAAERRKLAASWSGYRTMWTFVMFDLPVKTKAEKKAYCDFRKALLELGFLKMQYSVYIRFAQSDEKAAVLARRIREQLPPGGEVRILEVTGKQFEKMLIFQGKKQREPEKEPLQLTLF